MLYAVYFIGYYPVGAVAVVHAENELEAKALLLTKLPKELGEKNSIETLDAFSLEDTQVAILLDGNY